MKKLVLILALLLLPLSAAAAEVSDMILSPTGALYTIASEVPAADSESKASKHLVLTERRGEEIRREMFLTELRQRVREVREGPDGNIYILTDEQAGGIFRLEPAD